jgi:DNA-binding NarL/FixJ family response regulator
MPDSTILTITGDEGFLDLLRNQIHDQSPGPSRMVVAATTEEACSLLAMARPRLVVVHWTSQGRHLEELNRLLWATSVLSRQVPVLVIADRYRIEQATTLYRMGVREYISRTHHGDQFGRILESYLRPALASGKSASAPASADGPSPSANTWSAAPRSMTAQVV